MNPEDYIEFENQVYVKPETATQDADLLTAALRENVATTNQDIINQTANLGTFGYTRPEQTTDAQGNVTTTQVPIQRTTNTNWVNKYQSPVVESAVANINAVASQKAANIAGQNKIAQMKKQLDEAEKAANARIAARKAAELANTNAGGGGSFGGSNIVGTDETGRVATDQEQQNVEKTAGELASGGYTNLDKSLAPYGTLTTTTMGFDGKPVNTTVYRGKSGNPTSHKYNPDRISPIVRNDLERL